MEDTWKTGDLEKHLKRGVYDEDNMRIKDRRRRDPVGKKVRSVDSERRLRDYVRETTRERDRHREGDATGERTKPRDPDNVKDQDKLKEGRREITAGKDERERKRVEERERVGDDNRARDRGHKSRERRNDRGEKDSRDRERERRRVVRDSEQGMVREMKREVGRDDGREKDMERTWERDREKDRDREHNYDRRREKERHGERGHSSKNFKEMDDYKEELLERHYESKRENERRDRHGEREHSRRKEDKEYQKRQKEKEERERGHGEREGHQSKESRRCEDGPRKEVRERRRPERQEETWHHPSSDRRSLDQHGKRRAVEEGNGENGRVEVNPETRLLSGRNRERREPKETKVEKEEVEIEKVSAEGRGDGDEAEYYEEDFEDYEDDFEEIDESDREERDDEGIREEGHKEVEEEELSPHKRQEIEEIRRAMNAENERVGSSRRRRHAMEESMIIKENSDVPQRKNTQHGKFIDFVAAKHREVGKKIASKQKKRSAELLRLIDLDFYVTFSLLDLPPVNEYDMYIKSFGTTNTKQAYVQCNEDNTDRDVQTEEIEADDKWTQHPGDSCIVCGGPKLISEASDESMAKMNIDSKRLAEFLLSASQVIAILLEEDRTEMLSWMKQKSDARTLSCSDGCLQLNTKLPYLHGRQVSLIRFSPVQRQTLLSVHSPVTKPSAVRLDSKTILCIWNIWQPSCPQKVLVYESEVLCCCFSPGKATLVFAGTAVGSVVVWDLREHSSLHQILRIGGNDWTLRYPTFSTGT